MKNVQNNNNKSDLILNSIYWYSQKKCKSMCFEQEMRVGRAIETQLN